LRELVVERWKFDQLADGETCLELLRACLKDRHKRRSGVTKLVLKGCSGIVAQDVETLKKVVRDVIWDGS
jgi:hypothetical protein